MSASLFGALFDSESLTTVTIGNFLICIGVAILVGLFQAWAFSYKSHSSKSFLMTLAILPTVVAVVIMLVNGNVGTGIAVAGAFSLVRFRSAPGSAKEIGAIFVAMATGLMIGMTYYIYAILFILIISALTFLYTKSSFGEQSDISEKVMVVTIPEDLNYTEVFDDLLAKYTKYNTLVKIKTTNMGSLFKLTYHIQLKDTKLEKEFIDELRTRNGNLEIMMTSVQVLDQEL